MEGGLHGRLIIYRSSVWRSITSEGVKRSVEFHEKYLTIPFCASPSSPFLPSLRIGTFLACLNEAEKFLIQELVERRGKKREVSSGLGQMSLYWLIYRKGKWRRGLIRVFQSEDVDWRGKIDKNSSEHCD